MLDVLAEGDQAGKRCDQRARATDVDTDQKIGIVFCELREQDRRGDVTDHLAGKGAEHEGVLIEKEGEKLPYNADARHVSRKDEEKDKGEE